MSRDEFNKMLQWVQEIELAKGFEILKLRKHYQDGRIVEASWASPEGTVFRQMNPFTDQAEYSVDQKLFGSIVYRDIWA